MFVSVFRTIILYLLILVSLRLMGKRMISELQTSELVVTLMLSELAVLPIQNHQEPLTEGIAPMLVLVIFEILISFAMLKSLRIRQLICGRPVVIINDGKIDQKAMKKLRITTDELTEQLRQQNSFFLDEVAYAIIETNGALSVIKHSGDDILTPKQAGVNAKDKGLECLVISDGVLSGHSIELMGKTPKWVLDRVAEQHLNLKDVFMMTLDTTGRFTIIPQTLRPPNP